MLRFSYPVRLSVAHCYLGAPWPVHDGFKSGSWLRWQCSGFPGMHHELVQRHYCPVRTDSGILEILGKASLHQFACPLRSLLNAVAVLSESIYVPAWWHGHSSDPGPARRVHRS